jgi:4a-hydroxytetrahydrobiopterin dehydratase
MAATKLSNADVKKNLKTIAGWTLKSGSLTRSFQFTDFVQAFGFMSSAALVAEGMNHHPDWSNVYNTVVVRLSTHDVKGISSLDFELAKKMNALFEK